MIACGNSAAGSCTDAISVPDVDPRAPKRSDRVIEVSPRVPRVHVTPHPVPSYPRNLVDQRQRHTIRRVRTAGPHVRSDDRRLHPAARQGCPRTLGTRRLGRNPPSPSIDPIWVHPAYKMIKHRHGIPDGAGNQPDLLRGAVDDCRMSHGTMHAHADLRTAFTRHVPRRTSESRVSEDHELGRMAGSAADDRARPGYWYGASMR